MYIAIWGTFANLAHMANKQSFMRSMEAVFVCFCERHFVVVGKPICRLILWRSLYNSTKHLLLFISAETQGKSN